MIVLVAAESVVTMNKAAACSVDGAKSKAVGYDGFPDIVIESIVEMFK